MRLVAILLLVAGCGSSEAPDAAAPAKGQARAAPAPAPSAAEIADAEAAAATVRLYYEHIRRGDYRSAWRLREQRPGLAFERFAGSFAAYSDYRATVGVPTLPVEDRGFVWVGVPVQLYGRRADGRPFGSVGRVLIKRPAGSRQWRIVP